MKCPFCDSSLSRVVDKRSGRAGLGEIRRRRQCLKCTGRFTTYERLANLELVVIKKDGHKEPFSREKLQLGIVKALEKRPGSIKAESIVNRLERRFRRRGKREISSRVIGTMVLAELKKLDTVAYLRFASVYRRFENPEDFTKEVSSLEN